MNGRTKFEVRSFTHFWDNGVLKKLGSAWIRPLLVSKIFNELMFGWTLWMYWPNLQSVPSQISKVIRILSSLISLIPYLDVPSLPQAILSVVSHWSAMSPQSSSHVASADTRIGKLTRFQESSYKASQSFIRYRKHRSASYRLISLCATAHWWFASGRRYVDVISWSDNPRNSPLPLSFGHSRRTAEVSPQSHHSTFCVAAVLL